MNPACNRKFQHDQVESVTIGDATFSGILFKVVYQFVADTDAYGAYRWLIVVVVFEIRIAVEDIEESYHLLDTGFEFGTAMLQDCGGAFHC
jgi:hypothetical protein